MLGKLVTGYMNLLQETYNPINIRMDTIYTPDIGDLKSAMSSYNLRQMVADFDKLKAAYVDDELLAKLKQENQGGLAYNALQYKYSPLQRNPERFSNDVFSFRYKIIEGEAAPVIQGHYTPMDVTTKEILKAIVQQDLLDRGIAQREVTMLEAGKVTYENDIEKEGVKVVAEERIAVSGTISLECRLLTTSTEVMEAFQIMYMHTLLKNPTFTVPLTVGGLEICQLPVNTEHEEINSIDHLDYSTKGNLRAISFNVKLSSLIFLPYAKRLTPIKEVEIAVEVRNKEQN